MKYTVIYDDKTGKNLRACLPTTLEEAVNIQRWIINKRVGQPGLYMAAHNIRVIPVNEERSCA